jgi:hypothetical protein
MPVGSRRHVSKTPHQEPPPIRRHKIRKSLRIKSETSPLVYPSSGSRCRAWASCACPRACCREWIRQWLQECRGHLVCFHQSSPLHRRRGRPSVRDRLRLGQQGQWRRAVLAEAGHRRSGPGDIDPAGTRLAAGTGATVADQGTGLVAYIAVAGCIWHDVSMALDGLW